MSAQTEYDFKTLIRDIPDFPKPGIVFKDITPLFQDHKVLSHMLDAMAEPWKDKNIQVIAGAEARGFLLGPGLAERLKCSFIPVRKPGKLPYDTHACSYDLEYGSDTLEMHIDAISHGENVLLVDDLLATGGTIKACSDLVSKCGGNVVGAAFIIELSFLNGRKLLSPAECQSLIQYDAE